MRKTRKNKKGGGDKEQGVKTPDPVFPTKEQLLIDIGNWKTISCLKYKQGSVMVVENNKDIPGCKKITRDMKYIDKKYKLGKTENICGRTRKHK